MENFYLKRTEEFGRGLYASGPIKKGDVVSICEILVLSEDDTKKVNETDLKYYTFKYDETRDCLVLGQGEIFNHSDNPNVSFKLVEVNQNGFLTKKMFFEALTDIEMDEQLFIDYTSDVKVNSKEYIDTKSLVG